MNSKLANQLAKTAVEKRALDMDQILQWFQNLPPEIRNAIIGGLLGTAGTGAVSAATGGNVATDALLGLLLGAGAGGAGTAAYRYLSGQTDLPSSHISPAVWDRVRQLTATASPPVGSAITTGAGGALVGAGAGHMLDKARVIRQTLSGAASEAPAVDKQLQDLLKTERHSELRDKILGLESRNAQMASDRSALDPKVDAKRIKRIVKQIGANNLAIADMQGQSKQLGDPIGVLEPATAYREALTRNRMSEELGNAGLMRRWEAYFGSSGRSRNRLGRAVGNINARIQQRYPQRAGWLHLDRLSNYLNQEGVLANVDRTVGETINRAVPHHIRRLPEVAERLAPAEGAVEAQFGKRLGTLANKMPPGLRRYVLPLAGVGAAGAGLSRLIFGQER